MEIMKTPFYLDTMSILKNKFLLLHIIILPTILLMHITIITS